MRAIAVVSLDSSNCAYARIQIMDCKRQYSAFQSEIQDAVNRVLHSGHYLLGHELHCFEEEFAAYCNINHAIGLANGTDALEIALHALQCPEGSNVITAANAGMYGSTAILRAGARPRLIDIDSQTALPKLETIIEAIDSQTSGVIFTHLYGACTDVTTLRENLDSRGLFLIEDCAQAHGAIVNGMRAGSMGHVGTFSFYPSKNLGALGDAGAIVTNSEILNSRIRALRQYGWSQKYVSDIVGGRNSRLDEIQAAVLRFKLSHLDSWTDERQRIHAKFEEAAADSQLCFVNVSGKHFVAHLAVAVHPDRDKIQQHFASWGIDTAIHYPVPDHHQRSLQGRFSVSGELKNSEHLSKNILTLPCFPELTAEEVHRIQQCIRSIG